MLGFAALNPTYAVVRTAHPTGRCRPIAELTPSVGRRVVLCAPRAGPANALSLVPRWLWGKTFGEKVEHGAQGGGHVFA